jgi:AraC-like DNA-binding protein
MAEARALLAETNLPVAEVARRVGLSDPGYFSSRRSITANTSASTPAARRGVQWWKLVNLAKY